MTERCHDQRYRHVTDDVSRWPVIVNIDKTVPGLLKGDLSLSRLLLMHTLILCLNRPVIFFSNVIMPR